MQKNKTNVLDFLSQRNSSFVLRVRNLLVAAIITIFARPWAIPLLRIASRGSLFLQGLGSGSAITRSGEARVIKRILGSNDITPVVFDVGGNLGDYSAEICRKSPNVEIVIFEPSRFLYNHLQKRFKGRVNVQIQNVACSDTVEDRRLVAPHEGATTGSIYHVESEIFTHSEDIKCITIDDYIRTNNINEIGLLKVDVEGHELNVLLGASLALSEKKIQIVQFDGGAAPSSRIFFADFWELFSRHGYEIYRLLPSGAVRITTYRHTDECCLPTVYLALRPGLKIAL